MNPCNSTTIDKSSSIAGPVVLDENSPLSAHVERIDITEFDGDESEETNGAGVPRSEAQMFVYVFKLSDEAPAEETADDDENVTTCQQTILPACSFDGLWDSLIFDTAVKRNVLDYAMTAMLFSDSKVNPHIISWNRVVLLHGPPGTGKTSLCKALAHKLSIRLSSRSVFVTVDEVESLTAARKSAVSGSEPSDAIRVVNALLTQLDSLKRYSNVLILTTSNITEAIDVAFVDRADIKQYVEASATASRKRAAGQMTSPPGSEDLELSTELLQAAEMAEGFSGRALRKLPFQAHAFFVQSRTPSVSGFIHHLMQTIQRELEHRQQLISG
ncbi:hypothetical protein ON010_g5189 [Phytophthora cinnamomi]|nr:hypothetical protein ON010_g5189 [Phytophthora cinnamomi]